MRTPIDVKLARGWHFDTKRRIFESDAGGKFSPEGTIPKGSRIVYKVPNLARADDSRLNEHERELRRYMQVILPRRESPAGYVQVIRGWPAVEEADAGPEVSLPQQS